MKKLVMLISITVLSTIGWELGARVGFGTAWLLSGIGSIAGVYVAWRINQAYFE